MDWDQRYPGEQREMAAGAARPPTIVLGPSEYPLRDPSAHRFARGTADALGNSLSIVLGRAQMVLEGEVDDRAALLASAEAIEREAREMSSLVSTILKLSSGGEGEPTPIDVPQLVARVVHGHRRLAARLAVRLLAPATRPSECHGSAVEADLESAVGHLVENALRACRPRGTIEVATSVAVGAASDDPDWLPGEWVEIAVSDDGIGIAAEQLSVVFEPFFTTRPPARGLGLPLVARAVIDAGGWLRASSTLDVGTQIQLYIPRFRWPTASSSSMTSQ